jgi:hypothetical protein
MELTADGHVALAWLTIMATWTTASSTTLQIEAAL